ncbi:class F sortase [Amycolatopsis taiwanensis]|uniref:class F sortase n=1 Tax=Amycolatopsis taiwanensis TaxID=342230 RepID=UPI0004AC97C3|nr:class F sortase [Amycolatopsis taiwanensis]
MPAARRRLFALVLGFCMVLTTSMGCTGASVASNSRSTSGPPATLTAGPEASSAAPAPKAVPMSRSMPTNVRIPKIDVRSNIMPLGLNHDGTVEVPPLAQPEKSGWYRFGPTPGETGPAVLLAHVDGYGKKGAFYDLKKLAPGDEVDVDRKDGTTARFRIVRVDEVPKDRFPTQAVYGDTDTPQLRLITCGGSFDRAAGSYEDNVIAYASLF